jgi:hypothetical protein
MSIVNKIKQISGYFSIRQEYSPLLSQSAVVDRRH